METKGREESGLAGPRYRGQKHDPGGKQQTADDQPRDTSGLGSSWGRQRGWSTGGKASGRGLGTGSRSATPRRGPHHAQDSSEMVISYRR